MAFIVDEDRRVVDVERQLQFVITGSGSDGIHEFTLCGVGFETSFWAHKKVARVEGADPELPAPLRTLVTWKVAGIDPPPSWSREEVLKIITEAFIAYKYAHGGPEGQLVEVQFSEKSAGR